MKKEDSVLDIKRLGGGWVGLGVRIKNYEGTWGGHICTRGGQDGVVVADNSLRLGSPPRAGI